MDVSYHYCKIPLLTISSAAIIGNLLMIIFAFKRKLLNGSIKYIIYSLGLVDVLLSLLILVRTTIAIMQGEHGHGMSSAGHLSFRFIGFWFTIVQLTTQTAIACERYITVKFPIIYRNTLANASRKGILLSIWLGSAAVTLAVVIPSIVLGHPRAISIFCLAIYSLAMILTAGMYIFIFQTVQDNNMKMRQMADSTGYASKKRQEISRVNEEELLYLTVGIISTYFILNTPLIVFSTFFDHSSRILCLVALPCDTTNGVFANVVIGLVSLNKVCDPILYFLARYRTKKARNNKVKASGASGLANVKRTLGQVMAGISVKADIRTSGKFNSRTSGYVSVGESGNLNNGKSRNANTGTSENINARTSGNVSVGESGNLNTGKSRNANNGMSENINTRTSGNVSVRASENLNTEKSRNTNTGTSENINARTSGNVNTGKSGIINTRKSENANAGKSRNVNTGKSGNLNPETSKDVNAGKPGNVNKRISENVNADTSGKVSAGYVVVKAQHGSEKIS